MQVHNKGAIHEKLKEVFGYDQFRQEQETIIQNILDGKDTFVVMPTGGGKSLCYQIPALIQGGTAIVVSPLIALMKNQVDHLRSLKVNAAFLNSTLSKKNLQLLKEGVLAGQIKLLYVAPESLMKESNLAFLKKAQLSFVAVDEAHCISDWGHDFRPEYRKIKSVMDQELGKLPMIALTATATPKVQQDILKNLQIEKATTFKSSFNRENLYYEIRAKGEIEKQIITFIRDYPEKSGIVYCQNRKTADEVAALLSINGVRAASYHAGLDPKVRMKNQDAFLNKKVDVIVATIAFGMGIDKPDVRYIIHYDIPRSLEGYYQETGRAGRDGDKSVCVMFYCEKDVFKLSKLNKNKPAVDRDKAQFLLQEMINYTLSGVCRRKQLLYYFGETYDQDCNYCDNCNHPTPTYDGQASITAVLMVVQKLEECFDKTHITSFLLGQATPHIKSHQHHQMDLFGQGKQKDATFWESVIRQAQITGFLGRSDAADTPLRLTAKGKKFLAKPYSVTLHGDKVYELADDEQPAPSTNETYDVLLFQLLQKLRTQVAAKKKIPEYAVLQISSLEEMALVYPTTMETLARIGGLSMAKAQKIGEPFLACIRDYVKEHDIVTASDIVIKAKADSSRNKVYIIQQVDRKVALEEIAAARSLSMDALLKKMEQICYSGTKLDLNYYIDTVLPKDQQQEVYDYFMQATTDRIKDAKEALEDAYEEEELRLMRIKFLSEVAN